MNSEQHLILINDLRFFEDLMVFISQFDAYALWIKGNTYMRGAKGESVQEEYFFKIYFSHHYIYLAAIVDSRFAH